MIFIQDFIALFLSFERKGLEKFEKDIKSSFQEDL